MFDDENRQMYYDDHDDPKPDCWLWLSLYKTTEIGLEVEPSGANIGVCSGSSFTFMAEK